MQESNPHPSACLCHPQERNCGPSEPPPRGRYRCRGHVSSDRRAQRDCRDGRSERWALRPLRSQQRLGQQQQRLEQRQPRILPRLARRFGWSDDNITSGSRSETNSGSDDRPSSRVGSGREAGTSDERPSSDYSPDPPQFKKPKVTFGDGRTPGIQDNDPEPRWSSPAPEPAPSPPPPPEVITVPLNPPAISPARDQPGVVQRLVVAPTAGIADPLWGVAGLLLIPAAGAILGHRQARAAQSAAQLGRHP